MLDGKRIVKAGALSLGLMIAFVANKWFEMAWASPTDIGKWLLLLISAIFIAAAFYQLLPLK
jgi:hypothetical protein